MVGLMSVMASCLESDGELGIGVGVRFFGHGSP